MGHPNVYSILYAEERGRELLNVNWMKSTPVDNEVDVISHICLNHLIRTSGGLNPSSLMKTKMAEEILKAFPGLRQLDDLGRTVNMFYNKITGGKFDNRLKYLRLRERQASGIKSKRLPVEESATKKQKKWSAEQESADQKILKNSALLQKVIDYNILKFKVISFVLCHS